MILMLDQVLIQIGEATFAIYINSIVEVKKHMDSKRVFYSLLERVGAQGNYQTLSLILWSAVMMTVGASSFINAFLFYQENYNCPPEYGAECHEFICALPASQRPSYIDPGFSSLANTFGDYRCEGQGTLESLQSLIYVGGLVGVFAGALLNQIIGKRTLLGLTLIMNVVGLGIAVCGSNLTIAGAGLFLNFAAKAIQIEMIPCFISENVSNKLSGRHIMVVYLIFAFGVTLNGLLFKYMPSWQMVLTFYLLLPCLLSLFGLMFFLEEAPFDLVLRGSAEEAMKGFMRIAELNGTSETHGITIEQLIQIREEYQENERNKHDYSISILDLFRYKSLRSITIISLLLHFLISLQFSAPQLALKDYQLDLYLNGIIIGFSEVLAASLCYFIVDLYARKNIILLTQILAILGTIPVLILATADKQGPLWQQLVQTGCIFVFRFLSTVSYNFFYMMMYEIFPTQVRGLAIQVTSINSYVGIIVIPPMMAICEQKNISVVYSFTLSCILIIAAILQLPETYNVTVPDLIQELSYMHQDNRGNHAKVAIQ